MQCFKTIKIYIIDFFFFQEAIVNNLTAVIPLVLVALNTNIG